MNDKVPMCFHWFYLFSAQFHNLGVQKKVIVSLEDSDTMPEFRKNKRKLFSKLLYPDVLYTIKSLVTKGTCK